MFRLSGKQRGRIFAVADVGNGSVAIGIVAVPTRGPAHLLSAHRAALPAGERENDATSAAIVSLTAETAEKALAAYGGNVPAAYAIIHSPWSRSKTARAEKTLEADTKLDKNTIGALAHSALESEPGLDRENTIEAGIIRVELNGYPTEKPLGKRAHNLAASVLITTCDKKVKDGVSAALSRVFSCPPPKLRSDTRALLSVIRESSLLPKESLILNMTYEATNTLVVRKGVVTETAFIPEGSSSIVRRIGGDKLPEETMTLIRLLALDQCEDAACEATRAAMAKVESDIVKEFGEMFGRLSAARRLPNRLLLLTHDELSPWLVRFFSRIDFAQFTVTTRPFMPSPLSLEALKELVVSESPSARDVSLGIAAALVNMEEQP